MLILGISLINVNSENLKINEIYLIFAPKGNNKLSITIYFDLLVVLYLLFYRKPDYSILPVGHEKYFFSVP